MRFLRSVFVVVLLAAMATAAQAEYAEHIVYTYWSPDALGLADGEQVNVLVGSYYFDPILRQWRYQDSSTWDFGSSYTMSWFQTYGVPFTVVAWVPEQTRATEGGGTVTFSHLYRFVDVTEWQSVVIHFDDWSTESNP